MKMAGLSSISKPIQKNLPHANNLIGAGVVGIGSYKIARFLDGMIGNRVQNIGINLPFVGSLSVLDILMLTAFKATMRKNSMVAAAFAGDRVFNLAQNPASLIPGLSFGSSGSGVTQSAPATATGGGL